jgi:hypothetical protein
VFKVCFIVTWEFLLLRMSVKASGYFIDIDIIWRPLMFWGLDWGDGSSFEGGRTSFDISNLKFGAKLKLRGPSSKFESSPIFEDSLFFRLEFGDPKCKWEYTTWLLLGETVLALSKYLLDLCLNGDVIFYFSSKIFSFSFSSLNLSISTLISSIFFLF